MVSGLPARRFHNGTQEPRGETMGCRRSHRPFTTALADITTLVLGVLPGILIATALRPLPPPLTRWGQLPQFAMDRGSCRSAGQPDGQVGGSCCER